MGNLEKKEKFKGKNKNYLYQFYLKKIMGKYFFFKVQEYIFYIEF